MKDLLKHICRKGLGDWLTECENTDESKACNRKIEELHDKLMECLPESQHELLDAFACEFHHFSYLHTEASFLRGFRLAVQFILECTAQ